MNQVADYASKNFGHGKIEKVDAIKFKPVKSSSRSADGDKPTDFMIQYQNRWCRVYKVGVNHYYIRVSGRSENSITKYSAMVDIIAPNFVAIFN